MSLYLGNTVIAPNISNAANKSLSNLDSTGHGVIDGKADVDLTNINNTGKIAMAHNAMPSDTYEDLTFGASGTVYTAPADGFVYVNKIVGSDFYYVNINVFSENNTLLYGQFDSTYRTSPASIFIPVSKGNKFELTYNAYGATNYFRFIYAQGSESEA